MTQTIKPPPPAHWLPPSVPTPPPAATRHPALHKGVRNVIVGFFALGFVLAGVRVITSDATGNTPAAPSAENGNFYVSAGWSTSRLADLSLKMQRDDGISQDRAHCAMKNIAAVMTWLEWQAQGTAGQFSLIRAAETGCP